MPLKIVWLVFVFISMLAVWATLKYDYKKFVYILAILILPIFILGLTKSSLATINHLVGINVIVTFIATIIIISIFKSMKFRLNNSRLLVGKLKDITKSEIWLNCIVSVLYFIVQLLIIVGGDMFLIIR